MRYIEEKEEPAGLIAWKGENAKKLDELYQNDSISGDELWKFIDGDGRSEVYNKKQLKEALMREQGYICCYCGKRLLSEKIHHVSIEHLKVKTDYKRDTYNYFNLMASCLGGSRAEYESGELVKPVLPNKQRHCNVRRGDLAISVHPLQSDVGNHFHYDKKDGRIILNEENKLSVTNLGLNDNPGLNQDRLKRVSLAIQLRSQLIQYFTNKEDVGIKLNELISKYKQFDENGKLVPFSFVIVAALQDY